MEVAALPAAHERIVYKISLLLLSVGHRVKTHKSPLLLEMNGVTS
jgi:hypothetical protein